MGKRIPEQLNTKDFVLQHLMGGKKDVPREDVHIPRLDKTFQVRSLGLKELSDLQKYAQEHDENINLLMLIEVLELNGEQVFSPEVKEESNLFEPLELLDAMFTIQELDLITEAIERLSSKVDKGVKNLKK